jgi:hypothetical protein
MNPHGYLGSAGRARREMVGPLDRVGQRRSGPEGLVTHGLQVPRVKRESTYGVESSEHVRVGLVKKRPYVLKLAGVVGHRGFSGS